MFSVFFPRAGMGERKKTENIYTETFFWGGLIFFCGPPFFFVDAHTIVAAHWP